MEEAVGIFVKSPRPGEVKTRLGDDIGMRNAAEFYALALGWLFKRLRNAEIPFVVFYAPEGEEERIRNLYNFDNNIRTVAQEGEDLGERLYNGLCWMEEQLEAPPVIIGSDSPDLPTEWIWEAIQSLERRRMVLGPARDGGYYLIGYRQPTMTPFQGIDWSTSKVLKQTLDRVERDGVNPYLLPKWRDIDTLDDLMARL